jgi:hypothetical protein
MTKATLTKPVRKTAAPAPQAEPEPNGPAWKTQHNRVKGAIWRHPQPDGTARFTVSISRSYKDEKKGWVNTHFFDQKDLADVVSIASEAQDQILALEGMTTDAGED